MKGFKYFYSLVFAFTFVHLFSQSTYICSGTPSDPEFIGKNVDILVDESGKMSFDEVKNSTDFKKSEEDVPNLGFISGHVWLRFQVQNNSKDHFLVFELQAPLIDEVEFFSQTDSSGFTSQLTGQIIAFSKRKYDYPVYIFDLLTQPGQTRSYYMRIRSSDQIELPMRVTTRVNIFTPVTNKNFMFGIYCGMMIIMILYNLFVYFSVKDKSYLVYVVYILAILFTQTTFQGYTFKYVWPEFPKFETMSIHLMSIFVGFASVQFLRVFLQTGFYVPKFDRVFKIAYVFYELATILVLMGYLQLTWVLILCIVSPLSMFMLFVGISVIALGYKPAKFFTIAWSVFLVGVFIYAMKDFGILPHNGFTVYTMPVGSAIETV